MDPRFQNIQSAEDVILIRAALKKLNDIDPADSSEILNVKKEKEHTTPPLQPKLKPSMYRFLSSSFHREKG